MKDDKTTVAMSREEWAWLSAYHASISISELAKAALLDGEEKDLHYRSSVCHGVYATLFGQAAKREGEE